MPFCAWIDLLLDALKLTIAVASIGAFVAIWWASITPSVKRDATRREGRS